MSGLTDEEVRDLVQKCADLLPDIREPGPGPQDMQTTMHNYRVSQWRRAVARSVIKLGIAASPR